MDYSEILSLVLFILCFAERSDSTKFTLSVIPPNQPVLIGQKVILKCQVQGIRFPMQYAVLFKRKDKLISEKCHVYEGQKYHLVCEPNDWQRAETYELHIKSVSWADRGDWLCIYAANMTRQTLEVYAPAKLEKMGVSSLTLPMTNKESILKESGSFPGLSSTSSLAAAGMDSALSIIGTPPSQHIGLGTRTNPYDLRPGLGIQFTCETTCGHPRANITWLVINETMTKAIMPTISNKINYDYCNNSLNTINMTKTISTLQIHCTQLDIIGLNQVQCSVNGPQYKDILLTRNVYVLCPDTVELEKLKKLQKHQIITTSEVSKERIRRRGERPVYLTSGEVVGIAVGSALGLILVFIGCIILRNNGKSSPLAFHGHIPGQRV
ncbi:hypothetical protein KSF78_0005293 [Schistosoma japonicum]|nr:hypothetical protein KSF78_0005293 [Schistosoma japonicum]KAH8877682.1 hypothetical protein KSF78_0005293 [Schistosoma japonicum]KAH8877683.1 hypothetical protein KSF78_0005293 [Schistosoma japonicum]